MNLDLLVAFWLVAVALIAVPGPDWAFILAASTRDRVVLPAVAGLVIGYSALTALVAAGVGTVIAATPSVLTVLTVVGAAYLMWLGIGMLRSPGALHADRSSDATASGGHVLRGIGVSGLNPKGLLVFLSLLPQFTAPHASWPVPIQLAVLGFTFVATCTVFYIAVGYGAQRTLAASPTAARVMSRISGSAMIVVGIAFLLER